MPETSTGHHLPAISDVKHQESRLTTAHAINHTRPILARGVHRIAANEMIYAALRRAWMEVGAAHQKGHPACETCPYSVLEATEGDLSRVDSDCILGSNGEFPHLCRAIGSNA